MKQLALVALAACHSPMHHHQSPLSEAAIAVPIAPGQTEAWQRALEELTGPRYDEYRTSRERFGLTSQTTFLQKTPMGDFALIHMTGPDVHASFHAMSTSQDPWDVKWRELTRGLHGMDFATADPPRVDLAFETGPDVPGPIFMFVAPISDPEQVRELGRTLMGERHADYVASRARLGVTREAGFVEHTPAGDGLVVFWRCTDPPAALAAMRASTEPFDRWLAGVAAKLHPMPLDALAQTIASNKLVAQFPATSR
jgi:hypothetical protein